MGQKAGPRRTASEKVIKDIRRATRKHYSAEDKIRIVLDGLRGEDSIAELCRREGIAIVGRGVEKGEKVAKAITEESGVPVLMIAADLANIEEVQQIIPQADSHFGQVDILINAAGLTDRGNMLNTTPELFDKMFAVNTRAPFFLMQDAIKVMEREGLEGRIVNIGSASRRTGQPFLAPYSASKGALATLTRHAGYVLMRNRIHVNQLDIGWMGVVRAMILRRAERPRSVAG